MVRLRVAILLGIAALTTEAAALAAEVAPRERAQCKFNETACANLLMKQS